jgi:hypothetical protein
MAQQANHGIESAIVLAPANSLAEKYDSSLELAFRASLPELLALPKDKLLVVNVDVKTAVCLGLAVPERLRPWRKRILDELPRFDVNALDRLEQYAKALMHAQIEHTLARKRPTDIRALTEATQCRYRVLMNDARALAGRGMLAPEKLAKLTGCRRRADRVLALAALVSVLQTAWPRIEGKTALTLTELAQADEQAMQLMRALAYQKRPLEDLAKIAELRQRAFTVFVNAYTQARRAIQYLCPDEKAVEHTIPSLYPRQRTGKRGKASATNTEPVAQTPSQPTAAPASNQPQTAATPIQIIVTPAMLAGAAASEPTTAFASTRFGVMNSSLAGTVPQQQSSSGAPPETDVKQRKTKRRRRARKRERFLT